MISVHLAAPLSERQHFSHALLLNVEPRGALDGRRRAAFCTWGMSLHACADEGLWHSGVATARLRTVPEECCLFGPRRRRGRHIVPFLPGQVQQKKKKHSLCRSWGHKMFDKFCCVAYVGHTGIRIRGITLNKRVWGKTKTQGMWKAAYINTTLFVFQVGVTENLPSLKILLYTRNGQKVH